MCYFDSLNSDLQNRITNWVFGPNSQTNFSVAEWLDFSRVSRCFRELAKTELERSKRVIVIRASEISEKAFKGLFLEKGDLAKVKLLKIIAGDSFNFALLAELPKTLEVLVLSDKAMRSNEKSVHLSHLTKFKSLTHLDLHGNQISPMGAAYLQGLTALTHLNLNCNRIGPTGVAYLQGLTALTHLWLDWNEISDDGLAHLKDLTALTQLDLWRNEISVEAIADLKQSLPNVNITESP